jgi:hypothetical protein
VIARQALIDAFDAGEYYIADGGYRDGGQWSVTPTGRHEFSDRQKSIVRAGNETYNTRLKDWGALKHTAHLQTLSYITHLGVLVHRKHSSSSHSEWRASLSTRIQRLRL